MVNGADDLHEDLDQDQTSAADNAGENTPNKKTKTLPEIPISEPQTVTSREHLDSILKMHAQWVEDVLNPKVEVAGGRANLTGADLRGYDLTGANLSGASLAGACLIGVDLTGANLTVANLMGAQLQGASLRSAKLVRTKLDGADLSAADLTDALLTGTDLSKTIQKAADTEPAPARQGAKAADQDEAPSADLSAEASDTPDDAPPTEPEAESLPTLEAELPQRVAATEAT